MTITRNEILTALNEPDAFILAIVSVVDGFAQEPRYVRNPFKREPDFGATSVTYELTELSVAQKRRRKSYRMTTPHIARSSSRSPCP